MQWKFADILEEQSCVHLNTQTVTDDGVFQRSRGQLAQTVMVLICIWEVTVLNCGHDIDYPE